MSETAVVEPVKKVRINRFDNIKFLLIMLVVAGHIMEYSILRAHAGGAVATSLNAFIYSFHMPLFIFLSGLFVKRGTADSKLDIGKVAGFFILFIAAKMFISLVGFSNTGTLKFDLDSEHGLPWYMFVMGAYLVIVHLLRTCDPKVVLPLSILLAFFVGYDADVRDTLVLSRTIVFFPYFYAGVIISPTMLNDLAKKKWAKALGAVIVIAIALAFFVFFPSETKDLGAYFSGRHPYVDVKHFHWYGRPLTYAIGALMGFALITLIPDFKIPVITEFGKRTLSVYFFHWGVVVWTMNLVAKPILAIEPYGWIILLLLSIPITLVLSLKPFDVACRYLLTCGIQKKK